MQKVSLRTLLTFAVATVAAAFTTSCLDDDDTKVDFNFTVQGYVIQGKDANNARTYYPFIAVSSNYEQFKLEKVTMKNDRLSLPFENFNDWTFQTIENQNIYTNEDTVKLNGTYTVTALATTGESQSTQLKINVAEKDTLAPVRPSKLLFNDGSIAVRMPVDTNAVAYGVIVAPFDAGKKPERMSAVLKIPQVLSYNSDTTEVSFSVQFYRSTLSPTIAGAEVRVFAMGKSSLYSESDTSIVITPTD